MIKTKICLSFLFGIFSVCLPSSLIGANFENYTQRISLAISGGASKGAYEAGLNWGALKIMRNSSGDDPVLGGKFRPFEMTGVAGASAGGINSLLSGLSWCTRPEKEGGLKNRIDNNIFRDVWLNLDVNHLLPPTATSRYYHPDDALLSRYDLRAASDLLKSKWHTPAFRKDCKVPLGVTVTRVEPEVLYIGDVRVQNQRFFIPFELYVKQDLTAGFRFNPKDYLNSASPSAAALILPTYAGQTSGTLTDLQIEKISFASSAFPIAFSRQRLQYCRPDITQNVTKEIKKSGLLPEKIAQKFTCPNGYKLSEAIFADGGLFDNLPIGLARILSEQRIESRNNPLPVSYVYIDPDRLRYDLPEPQIKRDCDRPNPPAACRQMEFSLLSESRLLVGALGTARKYELYRELTSQYWTNNLSETGYAIAEKLKNIRPDYRCEKQLPYFDKHLSCAEAIIRAGLFLELSYDRIKTPITSPFSVKRLRKEGIVSKCMQTKSKLQVESKCDIEILRYRDKFAGALTSIMHEAQLSDTELFNRVHNSRLSPHADRVIRVSSLGSPITGQLLGSFGGFLDYKFREYDYYVGIYDVVVLAAGLVCSNHFSPTGQRDDYRNCINAFGQRFYSLLGVSSDKKAKYVFALLAKQEFGNSDTFKFAYQPLPAEDKDMRIIHEGLSKTLQAGMLDPDEKKPTFFVEKVFFEYLKEEGFTPTLTKQNQQPLLVQIMDDPDQWSHELVSRFTNRLVYLEQQAEIIFDERESNPELREHAYPGLMGTGSYALRATTYKYPGFTFSPSTAPEEWIWRNIIPFELGFDLAEGDMLFSWQPTWSLSKQDKMAIRGSIGIAGGLLNAADVELREDYFVLGLDYTRQTRLGLFSSYGANISWYHTFNEPLVFSQDSAGGDIHVGLLENRLRLSLGTRNFDEMGDTWYLIVGITDLPGLTYWLTR